jgi:transaldolase / glucose-6-phosphate isomerase
VAPFGAWLEQLVAESSGKLGKGIIPIDGEQVTGPEGYAADRLFVYLRREGKLDTAVKALQDGGQPVLVFDFVDDYDLGAEFYRWEIAISIACSILGVNAFDQPDVQDSKDRTKTKIIAYSNNSRPEEGQPLWEQDGIRAFSTMQLSGKELREGIKAFINSAREGDYVAINAYLPRNLEMKTALAKLRRAISLKTGSATTLGFGPRFLHSSGQLHKGGPGSGLFLQITSTPVIDLEIPGQNMSFGTLERAQALGDYEALAARGRRILRLDLQSPEMVALLEDAMK